MPAILRNNYTKNDWLHCVAQKADTLETWRFRFVDKYDNLFTKESECTENLCCINFPQNRKGKHSDIRYNKHYQCEEELKKMIMSLTQQHFLFYFAVHNTLAFNLWHLNKVPSVLSRKMGFKWSIQYTAWYWLTTVHVLSITQCNYSSAF